VGGWKREWGRGEKEVSALVYFEKRKENERSER
jgi:hypothetical protein